MANLESIRPPTDRKEILSTDTPIRKLPLELNFVPCKFWGFWHNKHSQRAVLLLAYDWRPAGARNGVEAFMRLSSKVEEDFNQQLVGALHDAIVDQEDFYDCEQMDATLWLGDDVAAYRDYVVLQSIARGDFDLEDTKLLVEEALCKLLVIGSEPLIFSYSEEEFNSWSSLRRSFYAKARLSDIASLNIRLPD